MCVALMPKQELRVGRKLVDPINGIQGTGSQNIKYKVIQLRREQGTKQNYEALTFVTRSLTGEGLTLEYTIAITPIEMIPENN